MRMMRIFIGIRSNLMTDHSLHQDILLKDPLAKIGDYYEALAQIARTRSFGALPNVEKLYLLMTVVRLPTEFAVLMEIARLNGITYGELCQLLTSFPNYFYELREDIWVTLAYAECNGYVLHDDRPHASVCSQCDSPDNPKDILKNKEEHPVKNGIICMSQNEIRCSVQAFCQSSVFRMQHENNYLILQAFMAGLPRPIRASDLNNVVYNIFGFSIARSTLRKHLCKHPDLYCTPTNGVWCSEKLARETPYSDCRENLPTHSCSS